MSFSSPPLRPETCAIRPFFGGIASAPSCQCRYPRTPTYHWTEADEVKLNAAFRKLIPSREKLTNSRWLRWIAPWLGHPSLWHWSRRGVSLGMAIGVFFGLLIPIAQIPVTAAVVVLLRANLPAAAASTLITNPVTFGPVYYAAFHLGSWATGSSAKPSSTPPDSAAMLIDNQRAKSVWKKISDVGRPLLVGLSLMASLIGLATYALIDQIWRWRTARRWRTRRRAKF